MSDEHRGSIRHRTLKGARIASNEGFSTFTCMVRNLSDTGALLKLPSVVGVPDAFDLVMDDGRSFGCVAVRRTATEIGVRFT